MWPDSLAALHFLSNEVHRSSGISRSSFTLMIPLGFYLLISKKINYKIYLIYIFFNFLMLSTQSRITLFVYFLGIFVFCYYIFFSYRRSKLQNKLKCFFIIIILPVLIWAGSLQLLSTMKNTPGYYEYFSDKVSKNENLENKEKYVRLFRKSDKNSFSSQRTDDWNSIIEKNQNIFLGYGVMGDRHLINQTASSLHFYNYASGGLFAVIIFLILIIRSIFICLIAIFKTYSSPDRDNYLILSASFIILFLIIRSIVESSFAVFGIDSLIFFTSYFYLEQNQRNISKN